MQRLRWLSKEQNYWYERNRFSQDHLRRRRLAALAKKKRLNHAWLMRKLWANRQEAKIRRTYLMLKRSRRCNVNIY